MADSAPRPPRAKPRLQTGQRAPRTEQRPVLGPARKEKDLKQTFFQRRPHLISAHLISRVLLGVISNAGEVA